MCCNNNNQCSCCQNVTATNTNITSNQAGANGLDAMQIAQLSGEFKGNTIKEFAIWNRGPKGDSGEQMYTNADW